MNCCFACQQTFVSDGPKLFIDTVKSRRTIVPVRGWPNGSRSKNLDVDYHHALGFEVII
jgi:hypothetical protein